MVDVLVPYTEVQVIYEDKEEQKKQENPGKTTTQKGRSPLLLGYSQIFKDVLEFIMDLISVISLIISTFHSSAVFRFWY